MLICEHCITGVSNVFPVCRTLGIPARSITNFSSAHDCDGSVSVDVHWDHNGNSLMNMNSDSIWFVISIHSLLIAW